METTSNETAKPVAKQKSKLRTDSLRVRKETKKEILGEVAALNKEKALGRPLTPDDYVSLAISLMRPEHREQLKERTLSNRDRLEQRYRDYCTEHGKVSKDEFLGILLMQERGGNG